MDQHVAVCICGKATGRFGSQGDWTGKVLQTSARFANVILSGVKFFKGRPGVLML